MEDHNFKNVIIFILFIFLLFFISNDKKFNKIFQKNIIKILFIITLVYMSYLKINICIILGVFFIFLLFNTDIGKKLQKNRYIKRIIKLISPFINPIIYTIEDIIYSFTNIHDDDSSVGSNTSGRKKVRFEDEEDNDFDNMDLDNVEDIVFEDEDQNKNNNLKINKEKENSEYDILDEIRNDMNIQILPKNNTQETLIQNQESDIESEEIGEIEPNATLDQSEVRELYKELISVKTQLNNIDD